MIARRWILFAVMVAVAFSVARLVEPAAAQNPETMLPEQSAAKARELIQTGIRALGGDAYLNVRDFSRSGRRTQFGSNGEMTGFVEFFDYAKLPDKRRIEYSKKHNIIDVYNGDEAWSLDREGVEDAPVGSIESFHEARWKSVDYFLRFRFNKEEGIVLRYGGSDLLDMKQADWVEIRDREQRVLRIAFERGSHLPIRAVSFFRNPEDRSRLEDVEYFSNYQAIQGIQTAFHVERYRGNRRIGQAVYNEYQYNTGLQDSLFTRESLQQRWAQLGGKKK